MAFAESILVLTHPRYLSGEILGQGGQGIVLRVTDRELPTRALVAKVFRSRASDTDSLRGEFALLARLNLQGLVRAHDLAFDQVTGAPFLVEDFVTGIDAAEFVWNGAERDRVQRLLLVLVEVARTLSELHAAGFTHGDLKPAHVRVRRNGQVVVLDLGAAAAVTLHEAPRMYTPAFAAPEVVAGAPLSVAADLFGLGALGFALATRATRRSQRLRDSAAWVPPSIARVIDALLAEHPRDRPSSALEAIRLLGADTLTRSVAGGALLDPIGRKTEVALLLDQSKAGLRYVVGPSGIGKSHLIREVRVRALLAGRDVRQVDFPCTQQALIARLVAFFRGAAEAWPFTVSADDKPSLCIFDNLHAAPEEFVSALDAWRCRTSEAKRLEVLVTSRVAPEGAEQLELSELPEASIFELAAALGIEGENELERARQIAQGNPGWLVALAGRVPLKHDMVIERASSLSAGARAILAAVAICGGVAPEPIVRAVAKSHRTTSSALTELFAASLLDRTVKENTWLYALPSHNMAPQVAVALSTCDIIDAVADVALEMPEPDARILLAIAGAPSAPTRREELLEHAAHLARTHGLRTEETEALFALAANERKRDATVLRRIERLTRDSGSKSPHPQVLHWLEETAAHDPDVKLLWLRRAAEQAARLGETQKSQDLALQALAFARANAQTPGIGLSLATLGAIALYRSDWEQALTHLTAARAEFSIHDLSDAEELARLEHNFGIVALFSNDVPTAIVAFERSLSCKRRLGDRAGVRSCLLNLGIALGRTGRLADAATVLAEAINLARSLGQTGGLAWCLAARAEIEVRSCNAESAEKWTTEAEALGDAVPGTVRADLSILRGEIALLRGDGGLALSTLRAIDPELRAADQMLECRAKLIEARAHLARLPVDRMLAARLAISAARMARKARLADHEQLAIAALRSARALSKSSNLSYAPAVSSSRDSSPSLREKPDVARAPTTRIWDWLRELAAGAPLESAALALSRTILEATRAERVLIGMVNSNVVVDAWGVDLDGFAISEPTKRLDLTFLKTSLAGRAPLYQRESTTSKQQGSRVAVAAPPGLNGEQAVVLIEHRFRTHCFDALSEMEIREFATLAALLLRLRPFEARAHSPLVELPNADQFLSNIEEPSLTTTALPITTPKANFPEIIGSAAPLKRALAQLEAAARGTLPVLLEGETGTGKELFARALHRCSARASGPFVAVNCAAIPESLFEAELFGHMRGAFTSADKARSGLIASAEKGTLLLDEIGELGLARQASLLRVLESRRYRPVGSDEERAFDVRIVAATNRNLEREVEAGRFRRDLLYRLNVVQVRVPPLRERSSDIPSLVRTIFDRNGASTTLTDPALRALMGYSWPGNVRELQHCVERLAALRLARVELANLPREIRREIPARISEVAPEPRVEVEHALRAANGNITHAAKALGITRHGLKKRMARLGMRTDIKGTQ